MIIQLSYTMISLIKSSSNFAIEVYNNNSQNYLDSHLHNIYIYIYIYIYMKFKEFNVGATSYSWV